MFRTMKHLFKILQFIWPPVGVWRANRTLKKEIKKQNNETYQQTFDKFVKDISSKSHPNELLSEIEKVEQSEIHRKEILESKAYSLLNVLGVSVALIALVPAILGNNWGLPQKVAIIAGLLFTFAIIHLLIAVYYATRATKVGSFYMMSADSIENLIQNGSENIVNLIAAEKFANTKMNQLRLIIKSNYLVVAQALFIRGIAFLGTGALVVLGYRILG